MSLEPTDRALIAATQEGLPLVPAPYAKIAAELGLTETDVMGRLEAMSSQRIIRRIAAAPNHYAFGMIANGMTVWDIDDQQAVELGTQVGALSFVSHCYLRPRALPDWPYNLFAMVHGASRDEVEIKRGQIAAKLGTACRTSDILYSIRILKKTGLRLKPIERT